MYDEKSLFLLVTKAGGKLWRLAYRFAGKQKLLALGQWPETCLNEARALRTRGIDPSVARKAEKASKEAAERNGKKTLPVSCWTIEGHCRSGWIVSVPCA